MPAEASRLERPVGARDRRLLAALGSAAVAGIVAAAVLAAGHGRQATREGCITFDQPGVMGGGTWHFCGGSAVAFCRAHAAENTRLAAGCARLPTARRPG